MKLFEVARPMDRLNCRFEGSWTPPAAILVTGTLKDEYKDWTNEWQDEVRCGEALLSISTHTVYISRIDAYPAGRGFGTELLAEIIAAAKAHSFPKVEAYVENMNADSKNLFRKAGFTEIPGKDGGIWRLQLASEEIDEAVMLTKPISIFRVVVSDHIEEQRALPERMVTWIEINRILNKIPRIKKQLEQMTHFTSFYIRDPDTGAELGCQLREFEEGKLKYVLFVNTVVRNVKFRMNAKSPIIEI